MGHNTAKEVIDAILGVDPRGDHPTITRSSQWPKHMRAYLAVHPACECCGAKNGLNVHHVEPYHLHPELELDSRNMITLCTRGHDCHLLIGHGGDFKGLSPFVREIAGMIRKIVQLNKTGLHMIHTA